MEDRADAIVVGGGVAGCTAAYIMAKAGLEVILIERGSYGGAKNMTGGRLYAHSLEKIMPGFTASAPLERKVTKERISMMTQDSAFTADFQSPQLGLPGQDSYTVLRAGFDRWLMDQAEEAGAMVVSGIRVDDLLIRAGRVCGVVAGGDEMEAGVVVLADGVNSLLSQKLGMKRPVTPRQVAVGVKEVIELPRSVLEDRFNISGDQGLSWLFAGECSNKMTGGGFLYTNQTSVSLGLVCSLSHIGASEKTLVRMLEDFKAHPAVAPLIRGGTLAEYSAHLVPEAGLEMVPELYRDGVVVIGDAAGFVINIGYMVRGMDLAIASADLAAQTIIEAKEKNDFGTAVLSRYQERLKSSFVLRDLQTFRKFPTFMENPRIFEDYPRLLADLCTDLFVVDGEPAKPLLKKARRHLRNVGIGTLLKDGLQGVRSL